MRYKHYVFYYALFHNRIIFSKNALQHNSNSPQNDFSSLEVIESMMRVSYLFGTSRHIKLLTI